MQLEMAWSCYMDEAPPYAYDESRAAKIQPLLRRLLQAMVKTRALRAFARVAIAPDIETLDDEALIKDFRQRCGSVFHPASTCRMARSAAEGVVDPQLRVFGLERLRVIDASAFPGLTSGNINAPRLMLAHRAAEAVVAEAR